MLKYLASARAPAFQSSPTWRELGSYVIWFTRKGLVLAGLGLLARIVFPTETWLFGSLGALAFFALLFVALAASIYALAYLAYLAPAAFRWILKCLAFAPAAFRWMLKYLASARAPAFQWRRGTVAAAFAALAAVLVWVLYTQWWQQRPEVLAAAAIERARAALAQGDDAAAAQALDRAAGQAPALATAFAADQAALYRELARRAQAGGDAARAALAGAEAGQWEQRKAGMEAEAEARSPRGALAAGMVAIPAGEFQMGCSPGDGDCGDNEQPPHRVKVKAFRMGKFEVTQAQWRAVMGSNPSHFPGDDRPVENVSWYDILTFLQRLNAGYTGPPYRLLSEAEWEYAARAGTQTPWWWGREIGAGHANCAGCGSRWDNRETAPAGAFPANPFGLHDTVGNVWEWVADCWHDSYRGAPADGSAWLNNCSESRRVLRGGSWNYLPWYARVSFRLWFGTDFRNYGYGLRLAQDLNP